MRKAIITVILGLIVVPFFITAQEASKWRGPRQNGYYPEKGLLKEWPAGGPEIMWQYTKLGEGYSSPAFGNNRIYVAGMEGETGFVYAMEQNGSLIWKAPYGLEYHSGYPGSRGTPVIEGDRLYVLSGMGHLTCMSSNSGMLIWKKHLFQDFDGKNAEWGLAETLLIHEDKLICTPGGRTNNVIALNKNNGDLIWSCRGMGEVSAYCSPLLISEGNKNLIVTHTANHVLGIDINSGKLLWTHKHPNRYSVHPNTPLYHDGTLFCFSGYGKGGAMLELNEDGSKVSQIWYSETMDSRIGGAVFYNDRMYGSGDNHREWQCIDWRTGKVLYESKEVGNGVVIAAEGMLYVYSQRGEMVLFRPGPTAFEVAGKTKVTAGTGQHWAHPVIDNGRLFVRHGNTLIAFDIREK